MASTRVRPGISLCALLLLPGRATPGGTHLLRILTADAQMSPGSSCSG